MSDAFWEGYSRLPPRVKRLTDGFVVAAVNANRRYGVHSKSTQRKGKAWVEAQRKRYRI